KPIQDITTRLEDLSEQTGYTTSDIADFDQAMFDAGAQADLTTEQYGTLMKGAEDLLSQSEDLNQEYRDGKIDAEELRREQGRLEDQFVDLAEDMGLSEDQARKLWKELREGDGLRVTAKVKVEGEY